MDANAATPPRKRKRRWFQFSLRTLLILVTLCCIAASWFGMKLAEARRQKAAVEKLRGSRVELNYEYEHAGDPDGPEPMPRGPEWLRNWFGVDFFNRVVIADTWGADADFKDEQFKALLDLPNLRKVSIDNTDIAEQSYRLLAELRELSELKIGSVQPLADEGFDQICRCKRLSSLTIDGPTEVSTAGMKNLARLTNLQRLSLEGPPINDDVLRSISMMSSLKELDIIPREATDTGIDLLAALPNLESLGLHDARLSEHGLRHFSRAAKLKTLDLGLTHVDAPILDQVATIGSLRELILFNCGLTDAELVPLRKMRQLESLTLTENRELTDATVAVLAELKSLHEIWIVQTGITPAGQKRLAEALPNATIQTQSPGFSGG